MKKFTATIITLMFLGINIQAQNNLIIQQSSGATTTGTSSDNSTYQINGIPAKEDIGGVEYNVEDHHYGNTRKRNGQPVDYNAYIETRLKLTNYHNCTVSVLIDYEWNNPNRTPIMSDGVKSFVLRANETKEILIYKGIWESSHCVNIIGMIVRKL